MNNPLYNSLLRDGGYDDTGFFMVNNNIVYVTDDRTSDIQKLSIPNGFDEKKHTNLVPMSLFSDRNLSNVMPHLYEEQSIGGKLKLFRKSEQKFYHMTIECVNLEFVVYLTDDNNATFEGTVAVPSDLLFKSELKFNINHLHDRIMDPSRSKEKESDLIRTVFADSIPFCGASAHIVINKERYLPIVHDEEPTLVKDCDKSLNVTITEEVCRTIAKQCVNKVADLVINDKCRYRINSTLCNGQYPGYRLKLIDDSDTIIYNTTFLFPDD